MRSNPRHGAGASTARHSIITARLRRSLIVALNHPDRPQRNRPLTRSGVARTQVV